MTVEISIFREVAPPTVAVAAGGQIARGGHPTAGLVLALAGLGVHALDRRYRRE